MNGDPTLDPAARLTVMAHLKLFLLSALLRMRPVSGISTVIAVVVSSLLFGALHAPAHLWRPKTSIRFARGQTSSP